METVATTDRIVHPNGDALTAALAYEGAALSAIPIRADGSKAPALESWTEYQQRRLSEAELRQLFEGRHVGVAVIGGAVSGNLETIDFDRDALTIFPNWCQLVEAECPGLLGQLSVVQTPKPGFHVRYRCSAVTIPGNTKLAVDPMSPANDRILIETRGEGGYALAPGCPPECHATGRTYHHYSGPKLSQVRDITAAEREVLIRCARSFDRSAAEPGGTAEATAGGRPGDDFNERGPDWLDPILLGAKGWEVARQSGAIRYLRRPGKDGPGWSATVGYCRSNNGIDLFAVFSSNCPPFHIPAGKTCACFSKFAVYALLHHAGVFSAAARALAELGYGGGADGHTATGKKEPKVNLTDVGNGKRLIQRHGEDLVHCHPWKKWLVWDRCRWEEDATAAVVVQAKETIVSLFRWAMEKIAAVEQQLEQLGDDDGEGS
jgi:putative DNA primase/helicase